MSVPSSQFVLLLLLSVASTITLCNGQPVPNVSWKDDGTVFVPDKTVSDEFSGSSLNMNIWNDISNQNSETGCPRWNGPVRGTYSTYFPGTTDPNNPLRKIRCYRIARGKLQMRIFEQPDSFFTDREYYCDATTRRCNYDATKDCTAIDFQGNFVKDSSGNFKINHDLCKKEPRCIPHHEYVLGKTTPDYRNYAAPHITSRQAFKYGFVEARVAHGNSSAVLAVWMALSTMRNGYCRIRRTEGPNVVREECPSLTRSRRWQEIDMAEVMNSASQKYTYHANVHAHDMYKGEWSSATADENVDDGMGGGPIIIRNNFFQQPNPSFDDVPSSQKIYNRWSYGFGPNTQLRTSWAGSYHILGLYWSPNEIRFYLDGVEVERLSNSLIHMPMTFDLSMSLSPDRAGEPPTSEQLRTWAKVDYMRAWKVFTPGGREPPSTLPLNMKMVNEFRNLYGTELYGVFDRFPVQDNQTSFVPSNPDGQEFTQRSQVEGSSMRDVEVDPEDIEELLQPRHKDFMEHASIDRLTEWVRQRHNRSYSQAGGRGNRRFTHPVPPPMSRLQRKFADSRSDRAVTVFPGRGTETIPNAGMTAYEFSDSLKFDAAWAATDASGYVDPTLLA